MNEYTPLNLAFLGDSVHTLYVREALLKKLSPISAKELHSACSKYCRASAQASALEKLLPSLSEEELDIVRRARNSKSHEAPKNVELKVYKQATSFEALVGYLYLQKSPRLEMILETSIS